jgi:hypothetical protein
MLIGIISVTSVTSKKSCALDVDDLDNVILYSAKLRNPKQVATMTTALDLGVNRRSLEEVSEKVLQGQDTIDYGSNLDRVPWVVSTVSCR